MRQVLTNLLENAVQAGDTSVEARVTRRGNDLAFEVRDHGPGLRDEDLPRLFEPFFTRRTRGTGLGLAIVKHLVVAHGGELGIESEQGRGTIVRFTVPIQPPSP